MNERPIRVLLVDDHVVVRSGLAAVLSSLDDMQLAGEAGNGQEAIRLCEKVKPDVVLMDLVMPVMDGVAATRTIHERWPDIKIITLTSFGDKDLVEGALKAGALSYLIKSISALELATAIRGAMAGKSSLSPEAAQVLMQNLKEPETTFTLTEREHEILSLMVSGLGNNEIAERLIVSRSTVKFHVSNILSKLGVTSRTEAVALALRNKLVK
jgi:NarL family two-component system response regulator LiaR